MAKVLCLIVCLKIISWTHGIYTLLGYPSSVTVGDAVNVTLKCSPDDTNMFVRWRQINSTTNTAIGKVTDNCTITAYEDYDNDNGYYYHCDLGKKEYYLTVLVEKVEKSLEHISWICTPFVGQGSNKWNFSVFDPTIPIVNLDPTHARVLQSTSVLFKCTATVKNNWRSTRFEITPFTEGLLTFLNNGGVCFKIGHRNTSLYNGRCGTSPREYIFEILKALEPFNDKSVRCIVRYGTGTSTDTIIQKTSVITVLVPVTSLSLTPEGNNNEVSVVTGKNQTFTCKTGSSRPAAWIQWYIGGLNATNTATLVTTVDGSKFISTSSFFYAAKDADHDKIVYCEAVNIEGWQKVKSAKKILNINIPVMTLTLTTAVVNDTVRVVSGETHDFTCTTNTIRPASWIQWFIGTRNVTDDAVPQQPISDGTKFISFSKLRYTGKIDDHNKTVHCEAGNIEGIQKAMSANKILNIGFRPDPIIDINAICDFKSIVVMWRSESNRGSEQMFRVVWHNLQSDALTRSDNVLDPGFGKIALYLTKLLPPMSYYQIYIDSTNIYGTVTSNQSVYCNTSGIPIDAESVRDSTLSFSAGFGSGAALIICINIVTIIASFLLKRRRQTLAKRSNVYEQTEKRTGDSNLYNELNELHRERHKPAESGEKTYEEISSGTNPISKGDNKRKKRGKKLKL